MIHIALKEWSVVCEALRTGRQAILVRKGGIHDGPQGFTPEHQQFWLFPTRFHQAETEIVTSAHDLIPKAQSAVPPAGRLHLSMQARVVDCFQVIREDQLALLQDLQILTAEVLQQRFHYRRPGLHILALEVFQTSEVLDLPDLPEYAGCHCWVELRDVPDIKNQTLRPIQQTVNLHGFRQRIDGV